MSAQVKDTKLVPSEVANKNVLPHVSIQLTNFNSPQVGWLLCFLPIFHVEAQVLNSPCITLAPPPGVL